MIGALVVEDEPWIRKGIIKSVCWDRLGIELAGEAENGEQALEILNDRGADLILMDMRMPRLNGIELLKELKRLSFQGEIVVLSEFSDYEYMRQAIYANVFEYLLKPVDEAELNAALEKAAGAIRSRRAERRDQAGAGMETALEGLYNELLLADPAASPAVCRRLSKCGEDMAFQACSAAAVLVWRRRRPGDAPPDMGAGAMEAVAADIRGWCAQGTARVAVRDHARTGVVALIAFGAEAAPARQEAALRRIAGLIRDKYGFCVRVGVGSRQSGPGAAAASYREACRALRFQRTRGEDIVDIQSVGGDGGGEIENPLDERKLSLSLQPAGRQAILRLCALAFEEAGKREYVRVPAVRALALDITHALERFCHRQGCSDAIQSLHRENLFDALEDLNSIGEIGEFTLHIAERMLAAEAKGKARQGIDIVDDICGYIRANYSSEIDLIHLAQEYHINYIHLSRLFKSRTGENYTDYLTRVRMEKARELIRKGGLKIREVAELVGYGNPYYFSSSYKKFFGHAPGDTEQQAR